MKKTIIALTLISGVVIFLFTGRFAVSNVL
jgi:hypothetical protein